MSPVFRHGGLRLYLLKLLDEEPRHGYDVIRLLQDKFLGVYSPSPGTIYPRLARLEEEGLVTHETIDGKKIYRITDAGRAELNRRLDDLADLEDELAASVRDIALEISRDVRETVRNLRDELTWAVREAGRAGRGAGAGPGTDETARPPGARPYPEDHVPTEATDASRDGETATGGNDKAAWSDATIQPDESAGAARVAGAAGAGGAAGVAGAESIADAGTRTDATDGAARDAGDGSADAGAQRDAGSRTDAGEAGQDRDEQSGQRQGRRGRGDWRDWADWADRRNWNEWADWAKHQGWGEWASKQEWRDWAKASRSDWAQWAQSSRPDWLKGGGFRDHRGARPDLASDLEHLAAAFAREIRGVVRQAENLNEDAVGNLGKILLDTLNRIRTEVFRAPGSDNAPESGSPTPESDAAPDSSTPESGTPESGTPESGASGSQAP